MDEVFKELDFGKLGDVALSPAEQPEKDCNMRNEIKELVGLLAKETINGNANMLSRAISPLAQNKEKRKPAPLTDVKPISASDQQTLDQAIAMAKELANNAILELDGVGLGLDAMSPRTPISPTKKKFTFKFKEKKEHKTFSEALTKQGESVLDSIISDEAKEAYDSLIGNGGVCNNESETFDISPKCTAPSPPVSTSYINTSMTSSTIPTTCVEPEDNKEEEEEVDTNPLRMLRGGVLPKARPGSRARFSAGPQTASLARLTANVSRSQLPAPPPVPRANSTTLENENSNPLPLPPRDRRKSPMQIPLKQHERKHPLLIQGATDQPDSSSLNGIAPPRPTLMSTFKPNMPLRKSVISIGEPTLISGPSAASSTIAITKLSRAFP